MSKLEIMWTKVDEAPALATYSLLPIVEAFVGAAGVSVQSVYFVFGNKPSVLSALLDVAVAGDEEKTATLDRPWVAAAPPPHPSTTHRPTGFGKLLRPI